MLCYSIWSAKEVKSGKNKKEEKKNLRSVYYETINIRVFYSFPSSLSLSSFYFCTLNMNTTAAKKSSGLSAGLSLDPWSDELMAIWVPIAVYWIQCSIFEILMRLEIPFFEKYRIHSPEDRNKRNKVGFGKVLLMVALQHVVQIVLGIALMKNLDPAADQMKYDNAINRYTTIILNIMANLGQPKDAAFTIASNIAHFIQNYMVPCVQFFTAM